MKKIGITFLLTFAIIISQNQAQKKMMIAELNDDGTLISTEYNLPGQLETKQRSNFQQIDNFPFISLAHPNFKNFRNVTIADLDGDQKNEIIVCLNETLIVLKSDGTIFWSYPLQGTSNFPPAVADVDGDGDLEIALQTYAVPTNGNVYLFDHLGNLQNGWPLNIENHFFLNGVTLADLDANGTLEIIASERISASKGRVHALNMNAESFNVNWPVTIEGTPAFTPSVGDINKDGINELITASTTALYVFNAQGQILPGFPFEEEGAKFSYQSPLLATLDLDEKQKIIGARHNLRPGTYVLNDEGNYYGTWPHYDDIWTFATPAVADIDNDGDNEIFFGRPFFSEIEQGDILLGYDHKGNKLPGFPIKGTAGSEGVIAIADVDNDGEYELITSSKATVEGIGFIHAYHINTQKEVENFPIEVLGFTYLNGAYLSDVNNDGLLDLTAISYQLKFDANSPDSAYVNVFNLEVPYNPSTILFNGYKGSNNHSGNISKTLTSVSDFIPNMNKLKISPNPASNYIEIIDASFNANTKYHIYYSTGQLVATGNLFDNSIDVSNLRKGMYFLKIDENVNGYYSKFLKIN